MGARITNGLWGGALAGLMAKAGRHDEALEKSHWSVQAADASGELVMLPEILRIHGDLLLEATGDTDAAINVYNRSLDVARRTGARWWELRSAAEPS